MWHKKWNGWAVTHALEAFPSDVDHLALGYGPFSWGGDTAEFFPHAIHIPARDRKANRMLNISTRHEFTDAAYLAQVAEHKCVVVGLPKTPSQESDDDARSPGVRGPAPGLNESNTR